MLSRVYIDNFRCFVNFEYRPDREQLIIGANGTGKSSLLDALLLVRQFAVVGDKVDALPHLLNQRTRWLDRAQQTWEIEALLDGGCYLYRLVIEPWGDPSRPRVVSETVHLDRKPIFAFEDGEVRLYNDNFEQTVTYPFDWQRSALATITPRPENRRLTSLRSWLSNLFCFRIDPFAMGPRSEEERSYPNVNLSNVASWYRHLIQNDPKENSEFIKSLQAALDGFSILKLAHTGENIRILVAEFADQGNNGPSFGFGELSDGQRCLICLYMILHFLIAKGCTVIIDEPDNFVSLREIQPWLMTLDDYVQESRGQVFLISHHPEIINQWAPSHGVRFHRDNNGPVRVEDFRGDPESILSPAELIARGWEDG